MSAVSVVEWSAWFTKAAEDYSVTYVYLAGGCPIAVDSNSVETACHV